MSIYQIDADYVANQLTPPKLRNVKMVAWIKVLVAPLQKFAGKTLSRYKQGDTSLDYSGATTYNFGDRVIYTDKSIYEATYVDSDGVAQSFSGVIPTNTAFWTLINTVFIGSDERSKYNAQKLLFEYALNRFFRVAASPADQIYITNNFIDSGQNFLMNTGSNDSSLMPLNSMYQIDYMGLFPTYQTNTNDYTIFVPIAVFTALGDTNDNRINAVKNFADIYNLAGMRYDVQSYI